MLLDAPRVDAPAFRQALGRFPTGVTVVTGRSAAGTYIGLTANSFSSVSIEPPLVSWALRTGSGLFREFADGSRFAVNVLSARQLELARRFARPASPTDNFADLRLEEGLGGVPLIHGCLVHFECRTTACHLEGDHGVFIGRVERLAIGSRQEVPLVFHEGGFVTAPLLL